MATAGKNLSNFNADQLPSVEGMGFAIITAEWNNDITFNLEKGAIETLQELGVSEKNILVKRVPGSLELIFAAKHIAETSHIPNAIIIIGCVIRGETAHFDYVCQSVFHGLALLNTQQNIPVIGCVLTDDTREQSIARSGGIHGNKGVEAAVAAVQMGHLAMQR
ncbi:MAG: 6,7-dimethyl-8-ribityllumazine synthase [Flavobacteriales bacterium]|nr:MAG: 6,7-dimethyl-8-ribityllumazine synthase [Flavobacteriales bacterium]